MNARIVLSGMVAIAGLHAFAATEVSSIDGLKSAIEAVNNGTSSDTTIRMAAGTYTLSSEMTPMTSDGKAFFEIKKSMTIEGSDTTSWRASGEKVTGTVIDAGTYIGSIFKITPQALADVSNVRYTTLRHLTLMNANSSENGGAVSYKHSRGFDYHNETMTNCVFKNNAAPQGGAANGFYTFSDCYFEGNHTTSDGGALVQFTEVVNSVFRSNETATVGGAIRNARTIKGCQFLENKATRYASVAYGSGFTMTDSICATNSSTWGGCAYLEDATKSMTISGCRFEGNKSTGSPDGGSVGAVCRATLVTNSVFVGNKSLYASGGALGMCQVVVDCAFTNNTAGNERSGSAVFGCKTVRNCDFYDNSTSASYDVSRIFLGGDCYGATLVTNCNFRNVTSGARSGAYVCTNVVDCTFEDCGAIGNAAVVKCGFFNHQNQDKVQNVIRRGSFTNCLVTGCCENYIVGENTELVNCTIVSNNQASGGGQLFGGMVTAVNTIFKDNYKNGSGVVFDVAGYGNWYFTNSIYKTHPNWENTYYFHDTDCIYDTAKLFEDSTRPKYDTAHPYKLRTNSPAVNAGLAIPGMAALTDYSGAGRVNGDRIDIGCYECWLKPLGFTLVFR